MDTATKIKLLTVTALVTALLGTYFTALHIDSLARERYIFKRNSHSVVRKDLSYENSVSRYQQKVHTKVIDAKLFQKYSFNVNSTLEYIFQYSYKQDIAANQALSVQVASKTAFRENPVLVVVRQQKAVLSWQLPLLLETSSGWQEYSSVSRQLCTEPLQRNMSVEHEFFLGVSTSDPKNLSFVASVTPVEDFVVELDGNHTVTLTASEPKYYQFLFPEGVTNVLLTVTSDDNYCMSVSIQNLTCPVFDMDHDLKYDGIWQTLMNKTGMTISRERFPYGFFFVFVVKADDFECTGKRINPPPLRKKTVHFTIHEKVSYIDFMAAVIGVLGIFALFYIGAFVSFCFNCRNTVPDELEPSLLEVRNRPTRYGSISTPIVGPTPTAASRDVESEPLSRTSSALDLTDIDLMPDAYSDKDVVRTKTFLFVADLSHKGSRFHGKKSQLYMWNLLIVAVFYALPVLQLVIIYQKVLNDTGDQDLCYFNFLCAHPLGDLTDFNHVYSNLGYVLLGLLFIINTARRDVLRRQAQANHDRLEKYYGIPQHYGLFYAMGTALMVEGVLSACYHICPTHANYQFDTTFMYVISMLCMLKIYQTRHPDINAEAHAAFAVLAFVVLIGVISVFEDSLTFRIIFSAIHLLACLALSAQVYYMGRWKLNFGVFKRIYMVFWNDFQAGPSNWFRPMYVDRMFLLVIGILTNVGLSVYGLMERPPDFASYMLAIFITNLMLYTTFYIIMKLRHGEKILCQAIFYIALASLSWGAAMYFFINKAITWRKRAAESRVFNQECAILSFYDYHDIWHFLSAASLFFSFMTLLTLDDDLAYTPRDRIPVF
ncbi:SID1 transmembrane family member 1-like isoform X2 [Daphnia pulex]|uniref:SID1 transmembrane family member 1-like isoform X2 n=1 Tax=Daphnia pulex TaxID=6669 RepID=UPI001EDFDCAF|nr:SID1 transmembrane family member 1-like isoform X2 [Daphnia pulex]